MLRPRLIPVLLLRGGALVKTVRFADARYVGDPLNAVRILNEKEVDELAILDIDASVHGRTPDLGLIRELAAECRMPVSYAGGVTNVETFQALIGLGVEKVGLSSAALERPQLIRECATVVGSQSVMYVADSRRNGSTHEIYSHNGLRASGQDVATMAKIAEDMGAGEVLINSIDRDGTRSGYDFDLISAVRAAVQIPISALGGAGSLEDVRELYSRFGLIGAAAGSMFVYHGKFNAVLINYPSRAKRREAFGEL